MINEAVFALQEGLATAEEIDNGMKLGCNHPIGPLALADMIGLDVLLAVMEVFHARFRRSQVPAGAAAPGDGRRGPPRPQDRPRLLSLRLKGRAMSFETIHLEEKEPGIYLLTINRPKALNALSPQVLDEIARGGRRGHAERPTRGC